MSNDLQTNIDIINEFTQRLQVAVIGAEETTTKHQTWVEGADSQTIQTPGGPLKTLRGQILEWKQSADLEVANSITEYDQQFQNQLTIYDSNFVNHLLSVGFEASIIYQPGVTVVRRTQTVAYQGVSYYWGGSLPHTTTGDFSTEGEWLLAQVDGGIEPPSINFTTGGTLVRRTQTVLGADGEWYFWRGVFPKVIPPGSSVGASGGVSPSTFDLVSGVVPLRPVLKIVASTAGFILSNGSFEQGVTVESSVQAVVEFGTGKLWRWDGAIPKIVPALSSPGASGGTGQGAWNEITSSVPLYPKAITDGLPTIDISNKEPGFTLSNPSATVVTSFTGGRANQTFFVEATNSNTTLAHNSQIRLKGGVNLPVTPDVIVLFVRHTDGRYIQV